LITGESGTGKELVAQALHHVSPRRERPLVRLSCAALPETLLEDELFGHEKGAFTDARERKAGRFEVADGGTIFLDDIDDLSLATQVKLLRVLQEREFERVGGTKTIQVDVRVVVAAKQDLAQLVAQCRFRDDLYFRLHVVNLKLPPLRERLDDLPLLIMHFCRVHGGGRTFEVDAEALRSMSQYHWPGNVRELENAVTRAITLTGPSLRLEARFLLEGVAKMAAVEARPAPAEPAADAPVRPLHEVLGEAERAHLQRALQQTGGNRGRTAELLGISRKNLWEKLKEHGLL
jgi:DNA-binding NtrC family response regulator